MLGLEELSKAGRSAWAVLMQGFYERVHACVTLLNI